MLRNTDTYSKIIVKIVQKYWAHIKINLEKLTEVYTQWKCNFSVWSLLTVIVFQMLIFQNQFIYFFVNIFYYTHRNSYEIFCKEYAGINLDEADIEDIDMLVRWYGECWYWKSVLFYYRVINSLSTIIDIPQFL